jgi:Replication factor-A protein 1, N-terminal domain
LIDPYCRYLATISETTDQSILSDNLTAYTIFSSQILSIKPVNDKERFRVVITDGVTTSYAMLATQMNDAVNDGSIKAFTVISVEDFITSDMNGQS